MIIKPYNDEELWSPEKYHLPIRSRLHHLLPIKVGTPIIESLTSYISRLAESHSVEITTIVSKIVIPFLQKIFVKNSTSRDLKSLFNRSQALNGSGIIAEDFVQALEKLTLNKNLRFLTLLTWSNILISRELLRPNKAWCSQCYYDGKNNVIYDQLLWSINSVNVCFLHNQYLCDHCPNCNKQLPWLTWQTSIGYCSYCNQFLGFSHDKKSSTTKISKWDIWVTRTLGELISQSNKLIVLPSRNPVQINIAKAVIKVSEGNIASFASLIKVPKNTFWGWYHGKSFPSLINLLKISYLLEIELFEILTQDIDFSNLQPKLNLPQNREQIEPRSLPRKLELEQIEAILNKSVNLNAESIPTIKEIAKSLNIDRRTLYYHFPQLCQKIVVKRKNYQRESYLNSIKQCCDEIHKVTLSLYESGIFPTEARVCSLISKPGYFRYKKVRLAYKEALSKLELR